MEFVNPIYYLNDKYEIIFYNNDFPELNEIFTEFLQKKNTNDYYISKLKDINYNYYCEQLIYYINTFYYNKCICCGINLGENNPRQYCMKTFCPYEDFIFD